MKKHISKFVKSCIWIQPICMAVIVRLRQRSNPQEIKNIKAWALYLFVSFIPLLFMWADSFKRPKEEEAITGKKKAMYPSVPKAMQFSRPTGVVAGKDKETGKYVCKDVDEDGHVLIVGGTGSGKSSCVVIPTLLSNPNQSVFAVDIKGELNEKAKEKGNENVLIFNPDDRTSYGYNPFYRLGTESTDQEILETMQEIAYSLISMPANIKDPFWKMSARNLFLGLLIFFYRQGLHDFVSIVDEVLCRPASEMIEMVLENSEPTSAEYRYIVQFSDMAKETLGGIVTEMENHLGIFANDMNIRYSFKTNSCKLNPQMLENECSIFLAIKEEKLAAYTEVTRLIINQTLTHLEKRSEDSKPVLVILDELPRLLSAGKIDGLLDAARTLRSRKVCLVLVTQSMEALTTAYSNDEVADLVSNCPYKVILSACSEKTLKLICMWCGKYRAKKKTWSGKGKNGSISVSYSDEDIVTPAELMVLVNDNETILITPYGYMRVKKTPYYEDKILREKAEKVRRHNEEIENM